MIELETFKPTTDTLDFDDTGASGQTLDVSNVREITATINGAGGGDATGDFTNPSGGSGGYLEVDIDTSDLDSIVIYAAEQGYGIESVGDPLNGTGGSGLYDGGDSFGGDGETGGGAGASGITDGNGNEIVIVDGGGGAGGGFSTDGGGGGARGGLGGTGSTTDGEDGEGTGFGGDGGDEGGNDGGDGGQEVINTAIVTTITSTTGGGNGSETDASITLEYDVITTIPNEDISSVQATKTHTGIATFRHSIKGNRSLELAAQRQDRINLNVDGTTEFAGFLTNIAQNKFTSNSELKGKGIAKILQETRPDYDSVGLPLTYTNELVEDVLRDYWPRTPFGNITVTDQPETIVFEDETQQSADTTAEWNAVTDIDAGIPINVETDSLVDTQICWTQEGESFTGDATNDPGALDTYSGAQAARLDGAGETASWTFTPDHDIPAENVGFQARVDSREPTVVGFTWTLNGNELDSVADGTGFGALGWDDYANSPFNGTGYTGGDLQAGTEYTLTVECDDSSTGGAYLVDVVAPYDTRYEANLTFDNDNGGAGGYLDGPELYPLEVSTQTTLVESVYNIIEATVTTTYDDTTGNQALAVSNDNGVTFVSGSNTNSLAADFTGAGKQLITEFTLSRYGSRTTATPQTGYLPQTIDDYSLVATATDQVVLVDLELSRNHFDNLQEIHEQGQFIWSIEHTDDAIADIPVFSFPRGEETKEFPTVPNDEKSSTPEVAGEQYYNSIYVQGRELSGGGRPTAEIDDQDAIDTDGRKISPGVLRDLNISSNAGAEYRAIGLLKKAQKNGELRGQKTIPATFSIQPGFAYGVSWLGDPKLYQTAEEVAITKTTDDASTEVDFVNRSGFARDIDELKRNARQTGDQL